MTLVSVIFGQIDRKWDRSGTFSNQILVHLGYAGQNVLKYGRKMSRMCAFLKEIGPLWAKYVNPDGVTETSRIMDRALTTRFCHSHDEIGLDNLTKAIWVWLWLEWRDEASDCRAGGRFSTLTADSRPHQRDVGTVGDFIRLIYSVPNSVPTNNRWAKPNKWGLSIYTGLDLPFDRL